MVIFIPCFCFFTKSVSIEQSESVDSFVASVSFSQSTVFASRLPVTSIVVASRCVAVVCPTITRLMIVAVEILVLPTMLALPFIVLLVRVVFPVISAFSHAISRASTEPVTPKA